MFVIKQFIKYNLKWFFLPLISVIMLFLPSIFSLIGLSTIGPIAGGLFSQLQGASIVSGSLMAIMQSFVMSGWAIFMQMSAIYYWIIILIYTFAKKILNKNIF